MFKSLYWIAFVFLFFIPPALWAQSNDKMDLLLEQSPAQLETAGAFILESAGIVPQPGETATALLAGMKLVPASAQPADHLSWASMAHVLMKVRRIEGGAMYRLFPGPHYAFRYLRQTGVIPAAARPDDAVTGEDVIRSLGRTMTAPMQEPQEPTAPEPAPESTTTTTTLPENP